MDEDELKRVGNAQPTIDKIEIVEFESVEELREWVQNHAPAFAR
jgi:hypothetical protein